MAHKIYPGESPDFTILEYFDDLEIEDMHIDDALGLNNGHPIYIMLDASQMNIGLPYRFMDNVLDSFFVHRNMAHIAIYLKSSMLINIAKMVAKTTRREAYLSIHNSREEALAHLKQIMAQET